MEPVEAGPTGDYLTLVVGVRPGTDGTWYVYVAGTHTIPPISLKPATLIVRLSRSVGMLRGTIQLEGTDFVAPIHTNRQLQALLRAWLVDSA